MTLFNANYPFYLFFSVKHTYNGTKKKDTERLSRVSLWGLYFSETFVTQLFCF